MSIFSTEADFESAVIHELSRRSWESKVIKNPSEQDLLSNWAAILFENIKGINRLNNVALTDGKVQQIMEQITALQTVPEWLARP